MPGMGSHEHRINLNTGDVMSSYPATLLFMETIASQRDREEAVARKWTGFGYFLMVPALWILPYILVYEFFRMRQD
jgi:hypothetical protein